MSFTRAMIATTKNPVIISAITQARPANNRFVIAIDVSNLAWPCIAIVYARAYSRSDWVAMLTIKPIAIKIPRKSNINLAIIHRKSS